MSRRIIVLCGASATGKTSWVMALMQARPKSIRIGIGQGGPLSARAASAVHRDVDGAIASGHDVIIDCDGGVPVPVAALHGLSYEVRHFAEET